MPRLLFITYKRLSSIMEGGGQCSQRNYQNICTILGDDNVDCIYIHDDDKHRSLLSYLQAAVYMPFGYYFGLTPARCKQIVRQAQQYDYVFIDRSLFGIIAKQLKANGYKGKIITFFHNIEKVYLSAKLSTSPSSVRTFFMSIADKNDNYSCTYSDKIIALNKRDADILYATYHRQGDIVPISLNDKYDTPSFDTNVLTRTKPLCLFLGAYFSANNEGILWFVRNVLPKVNIEMKIVGKGMSKLKQEAPELKDIEVVSDAPDLRPYLEEADLMILPIFSGSGMKVKTCESLMYGKNIIGTDEAFEGYNIENGTSGWRCNNAEEMVSAIDFFCQHPQSRFNHAARDLFLKQYSIEATTDMYRQIIK